MAQVNPVLLLVLGVEQRLLDAVSDDFGFAYFVLLLLFLVFGEAAAVYGTAICPDGPNVCDELPGWTLPIAGAGLAAGLAGMVSIAAVGAVQRESPRS